MRDGISLLPGFAAGAAEPVLREELHWLTETERQSIIHQWVIVPIWSEEVFIRQFY